MTDLYRNKYRIPSARLDSWDYGSNAAYFVTICTRDRVCYFGDIVAVETRFIASSITSPIASPSSPPFPGSQPQPEMQLSEIGEIANQCWLAIPGQFPFARLGNHIVMPNHVHGIIIIDKPNDDHVETRFIASPVASPIASPITSPPPVSPPATGGITGLHNPMLHENLSKIIRWYKGRVTFESRKIQMPVDLPEFGWQPRFHDHIIRDEKSFLTISAYIKNNPLNWMDDEFFI